MAVETKYARKGSAVQAALAATKKHPSAEALFRELKAVYPNISRTTVYTNLARLQEEGSIICVGVVDGCERYDADIRPHPHFICEGCGSVLDLAGLPDILPLERLAEEKNGVSVRAHELIFRGLCADCTAKNEKRTEI